MSTINFEPIIRKVINDLTDEQVKELANMIDGKSSKPKLLRTMSIKPVGNRTNITTSDKGVNRCNLEFNFSLFEGYLLYTENYCILIHHTDSQILGMFKINVEEQSLSTVSEFLNILELRTVINERLITAGEMVKIQVDDIDSGDEPGGKVIFTNGNGGAEWGEINLATYKSFPSTWTVSGTTKQFCDSVNADASAVEGMAYVGELSCIDLPFSGNADVRVEVISQTSNSKVIHLVATSGNIPPYRWEYTYWDNGSNVSGWISFANGNQVETVSANFAPEFSSASNYSVGDVVVYNNVLYVCSNDHSGAWDSNDFTQSDITTLILGLINTGV